ncbi:superoxide dismutase family protein [Desulfurivibrio dismutans]|uniref:superoxide dismutase family protein n=1 Tax=Desulfurivibrio dismutans TaxID=1398908 RepID=UPI0023DA3660|nr:superoxide dismutase family protein [Desulfurivibrio alkaliphilus]MDF1614379.1 superoxide dismutase family protein [Desulfurivibrio alkaliphilus]
MKMKKTLITVAAVGIVAVGIVAAGSATAGGHTATAQFMNTKGEAIGKAELTQSPHGTLIRLELRGLADSSGFHAIHIHAVGDCSDHDDGFQASGGHINPEGKKHGLMNSEGPDPGDFPNIYADAKGDVNYELFTTLASLDGSVGARILGEDGAALVIHQNPDDHKTQPIGGAGSRIACGVINR